jgi:hypothetical protein
VSITDWQESEQRRLVAEYVATQIAGAEWEARKARRKAARHELYRWCNPFRQFVSDVGRMP